MLPTKDTKITPLYPTRISLCLAVVLSFSFSNFSSCSKLDSWKSSVGKLFKKSSQKIDKENKNDENLFSYFKVKKLNISDTVAFNGVLEPSENIEISADKIMRIGPAKFKVGDRVKRGSVLFVVDTKDLEQRQIESKERVDQLLVDIKSSRAQFTFALKQLERKGGLVKKGIAAQRELEEAEKFFVSAEADLKTKELELRKAERELIDATRSVKKANVISPIDGVLTTVAPGGGGDDVRQGQNLVTIANPTNLVISGQVDEVNVTKFNIGQSVDVSLDVLKNSNIKGTVTRIDASRDSSSSMALYTVIVEIPTKAVKSNGLRAGYTAKVSLTRSSKNNTLVIPRSALKQEGSQFFVMVSSRPNALPLAKSVKIGIQTELETEILDGLNVGDRVAVNKKTFEAQ